MRSLLSLLTRLWLLLLVVISCDSNQQPPADLVLKNTNIYTLSWPDPSSDGTPNSLAPLGPDGWRPDAQAIAITDGLITFIGSNDGVAAFIGENTKVLDLEDSYLVPGLVDGHTHVQGLGQNLDYVDLKDVATEEEAVQRVVEWARNVPEGEWIVGRGWDEGAWANNYPDKKLLSEMVPNHPVFMNSLHGFAAWGNEMALERANINIETPKPVGGDILKDENGVPTGLLLNNATDLLSGAIPPPDKEKRKSWVMAGLEEMARSGYVAIHDAGVGTELMEAFMELDEEGKLPLRVYAMIRATDEPMMKRWQTAGPYQSESNKLFVKSVKAFYDGALGSRGAKLIEDYSDRPGHRGVSGEDYGFNQDLVQNLIDAGFQVGIHAIGDAGNRETIEFLEKAAADNPQSLELRHRIEHAQVIHANDFERIGQLQLIASMQPPHAAEDKTWAEDRLGPDRILGAYAWRTLLQTGTGLVFGSDLTGSDHDIFYGLHSAISRRSKDLMPAEGWHMQEAVTEEEALRAYSSWAAYASFLEEETGKLQVGKWADITVLSIDPLESGRTNPGELLNGEVVMTIVGGEVVFEK